MTVSTIVKDELGRHDVRFPRVHIHSIWLFDTLYKLAEVTVKRLDVCARLGSDCPSGASNRVHFLFYKAVENCHRSEAGSQERFYGHAGRGHLTKGRHFFCHATRDVRSQDIQEEKCNVAQRSLGNLDIMTLPGHVGIIMDLVFQIHHEPVRRVAV